MADPNDEKQILQILDDVVDIPDVDVDSPLDIFDPSDAAAQRTGKLGSLDSLLNDPSTLSDMLKTPEQLRRPHGAKGQEDSPQLRIDPLAPAPRVQYAQNRPAGPSPRITRLNGPPAADRTAAAPNARQPQRASNEAYNAPRVEFKGVVDKRQAAADSTAAAAPAQSRAPTPPAPAGRQYNPNAATLDSMAAGGGGLVQPRVPDSAAQKPQTSQQPIPVIVVNPVRFASDGQASFVSGAGASMAMTTGAGM